MKCISRKILCFIICGLLTFSVTSTVYYNSVHAMEWVGGALAFEEALKWLLAAIGITATAGMSDAYWESYGDDFTDYAIENGVTQTEVAEWQLKACEGIIDKGSVVWSKFKAWAYSLVHASGPVDINFQPGITEVQTLIPSILGNFNYSYTLNNPTDSHLTDKVYAFRVVQYSNYLSVRFYLNSSYSAFYFLGDTTLNKINSSNMYPMITLSVFNNNTSSFNLYEFSSPLNLQYLSSGNNGYDVVDSASNEIVNLYYGGDFTFPVSNSYFHVSDGFDGSGSVADENFDSVTTNVNDLDVISSDGVDENDDEVTVPMPGVSDSDNEVSKDAYQEIIDAINDGTITQEEGVEKIQEILKIITYDTVTDKVVPPQVDPDTGEDETKDDVLKENKENFGFTLGGLEAVFPFCIPFDIYAFMTLLVADPEAPEFDFPIQSVNGEVEEIHVDLSPFEPVAVVVRYCFDFLFIIGLALATRELIGAGGGD